MTRGRWPALALGVLVSGVLLFLAFREVEWVSLGQTLANVHPAGLAACVLMVAGSIVARGFWWSLIEGRPVRDLWMFERATNMGVLGNQLLPGRLGEGVRVVVLTRLPPSSRPQSLGSALIDRMLDVAVLVLSAWGISSFVAVGVIPQGWMLGMGLLVLVFAVGIPVVRTRPFQSWLSSMSIRWLHRWGFGLNHSLPP